MAMDYLPIQTSSVPCERAFSSAAQTDTRNRNRLSTSVTEALQILKHYYKAERGTVMDFVQPWLTPEEDMKAVLSSEDQLSNLFRGDRAAALDAAIAAIALEEGEMDDD